MKENKMGTMEMKKLIITMAFPIMISMLVQALYNIVDSMFVSRVSEQALAAVSLCYPVQMVMIAVACGTGVGVNALLSRYLGQGKHQQANRVAGHGLVLSLFNGAIFALFGLFLAQAFLKFFTQDETILNMGISYMKICTIFSVGVFVQITYERIMQSTGNTFYNMVIQGVGALINIILDPIFIFTFDLGVAGAAYATVCGQMVAMFLGIYITNHKIKDIHITVHDLKLKAKMLMDIYRIAIPAILMQSIMSFTTIFMNMILVHFDEVAVSCFSVYFKLQQFVFMAVSGLTNALIPIVAYNYGARNKDRIIRAIKFSIILTLGMTIFGTVVFQFMPSTLLGLFDASQKMLEIGIPALKIISISFVAMGISMVLCCVFQALDHGAMSLVITILRQMVILMPLFYLFSQYYGLEMAWWAFVITEYACLMLAMYDLHRVKKTTINAL